MKKRIVLFTLILCMLAAVMPTGAAGTETARETEYGIHLTTPQIAEGPLEVSVMIPEKKRNLEEADSWKAEIRYFPADPETGLFDTGDGRAPGEETEWVRWLEDGYGYTVRLKQPGKYLLSGVPVYVLDSGNAKHAALREELFTVMERGERNTERETAAVLYDWTLGRVNGRVPEEFSEACRDPLNALLTGYAAPEAYAQLLRIILKQAGIESVRVNGKIVLNGTETDWTWCLIRLDEQWLYADPAMDDIYNGWSATYAKEWAGIAQNHILSPGAEAFTANWIGTCFMDVAMSGDRPELMARMKIRSMSEGTRVEFIMIDGPRYSVGPSEPVRIRVIQNYTEPGRENWGGEFAEENIRMNVIGSRSPWQADIHAYPNLHSFLYSEMIADVAPEDVTILSYNGDLTDVTVRFNTPGLYLLTDGTTFCVLDPGDEEQARMGALLEEARTKSAGGTEQETAKKLQDWEASVMNYDYESFNYSSGTGNNEDNPYNEEMELKAMRAHEAYGALANGLGVCEAYAGLYQVLLSGAGIPSLTVAGDTRNGGHVWNLLRIDGKWVQADPTWDDAGGYSGTQYFCRTTQQFAADHKPYEGTQLLLDTFTDHPVYSVLADLFDRRYAPGLDIPEELRVLPADVSGFGFPEQWPNFFTFNKLEADDFHLEYDASPRSYAEKFATYTILGLPEMHSESDRLSNYWPVYNGRYMKGTIYELTLADYLFWDRPLNTPVLEHHFVWGRGELEETRFSALVPMAKNQIRGFSEKSYRTWTYDMDQHKTEAGWTLEKKGTLLTVTAYFDPEGKTARYAVFYEPEGGNKIRWEAAKDGRITGLRADRGDLSYTLTDLTDKWTQQRYETFRKKVLRKYPSVTADAPLGEGVYLYMFCENFAADTYPNYYNGEAIATRDPIFIWTEGGKLELNPDARDLNGDPIELKTEEPLDLSFCCPLQIGE